MTKKQVEKMHQDETAFDRQDRDVERRVTNYLAQHFPRLRTVEVEARQGVVTIAGHVNTFYERQLCINCCQRVAGVMALNDKVEVAQASGSSGSSGTTASGQTSTDQSTTTTTTKTTKKHHRRHKKSASGDTTANPNGASSTTPK